MVLSHWPHPVKLFLCPTSLISLWPNYFHHNDTALVFHCIQWQEADKKKMTKTNPVAMIHQNKVSHVRQVSGSLPTWLFFNSTNTTKVTLWSTRVKGRKWNCLINNSRDRSGGHCVSCQRPHETSLLKPRVDGKSPYSSYIAYFPSWSPPCPSEVSIIRVTFFLFFLSQVVLSSKLEAWSAITQGASSATIT